MGASGIETASLDRVVAVMSKGNEAVKFFSELCDEDPKRKGRAISQLAEIQLKAGKKLKSTVYKESINEALYDAAMAEFRELEPSFIVLAGKTMPVGGTSETAGGVACGSGKTRTPAAVHRAAEQIYAWLCEPRSKWRSLMALLSGGGLFYVTSVHETCNRAYILHERPSVVTAADYAEWSKLRLCRGQADEVNDLDGL